MMQTAGNPLLNLLSGNGANPVSMRAGLQQTDNGKPASGFAALFAGVQTQQNADGTAVNNSENPLISALKSVLPVLEEIKAAVAVAEDLPAAVSESILETLDQLSGLIGDWIEGEPVSSEQLAALLPEGLPLTEGLPLPESILLPDGLTEGTDDVLLTEQTIDLSLENLPPAVVVNIFQEATQSVVSEISKAVAINELPSEQAKALNLGALVGMVGKVQKAVMTRAPSQHPVAIANGLDQSDLQATRQPETVFGDETVSRGEIEIAETLYTAGRSTSRSTRDGTATSFGDFVQKIAASPAHAAGAIDVPKEMVQIIPEEMASALQAVTETQTSSAQAQQAAGRTDAPQTKFAQAVVGQLRSVDIQEGTTKVELNPRGLGNVEIEMKTNSDGSLSVVVRAESAHVLSSLRDERDLLAQIIAQGGDASVDIQDFSSEEQQSFEGQSGYAGEAVTGEDSEDAISEAMQNDTIGNGQLDLMT